MREAGGVVGVLVLHDRGIWQGAACPGERLSLPGAVEGSGNTEF
jgi:hypothetical protein